MRDSDFIAALARLTPWSRRDIEERWRRLCTTEVLPPEEPDPADRDIGPVRASYLLIALAAANSAAEADGAVMTYAALPARGETFAERPSFGEALAAMLGNEDIAALVDDVVVCRTWPSARIEYTLSSSESHTAHYADAEEHRTHGARVEAGLGGGLLRRLAAELAGSIVSGSRMR